MALYRKQKPKIFKTDDVAVGNADTSRAFKQPIPERSIEFQNALPSKEDYNNFVIKSLQKIQNEKSIIGSNLPLLNKESSTEQYIKPIFLGSPKNPSPEFLYANPSSNLNIKTNESCDVVFLFASIQSKKSNRGFKKITESNIVDKNIPNILTTILPSGENESFQTIFLEQTDNDSKIKINAYDLNVNNVGKGVNTTIQSPVLLDTWYNTKLQNGSPDGRSSRWIDYNIGNNVTIGAINDSIIERKVAERLDWSFGSIFLVKTFGSSHRNNDEKYREVKYIFDPLNGTVKLVDWEFTFTSSPTTYVDRYTTKVDLIDESGSQVDTELLNKTEITNGVLGRKIYTYFIKAFEEGECIRIEDIYGGIKINVDFNYNGNCCTPKPSSVSSIESCFTLEPDNINVYDNEVDTTVCVKFDGKNGEIGYMRICDEDIPVTTVNGFLTWNYNTPNQYVFTVFNECKQFYTSNGCLYEVCFTGYPKIKFTLKVLSVSSSSDSSVSYSSSSSTSLGFSSSSESSYSSYIQNQSSSSSSSFSSFIQNESSSSSSSP